MEFDHVAISVNKLEESIEYYTDHFGFVVDGKFEKPLIFLRFAFIKKENFRIELFEFKDKVEGRDDLTDLRIRGLRHLAFKVQDIKHSMDVLKNSGLSFGPVKSGTSCKYYAFTTDPNGVSIELYEPNK